MKQEKKQRQFNGSIMLAGHYKMFQRVFHLKNLLKFNNLRINL